VLDDPRGILPLTGRPGTDGEIEYDRVRRQDAAHRAVEHATERARGRTAESCVTFDEVRRSKEAPGVAMHAVGGRLLSRA